MDAQPLTHWSSFEDTWTYNEHADTHWNCCDPATTWKYEEAQALTQVPSASAYFTDGSHLVSHTVPDRYSEQDDRQVKEEEEAIGCWNGQCALGRVSHIVPF